MAWQPSTLSDTEARAWRLIEQAPAPGKHAARNAVFHIERANLLEAVDPEMAIFRAITAEEEAVRAIFHALQRHAYPNANRLNWRDHRHKAAVVPFLQAVAALIASAGFAQPQLVLEENGGADTLRVRIKVPNPIGSGDAWLLPDPPLDFNLEVDGKRHDFRPEINALLAEAKVAEFMKFVRDRANERNRVLYATTDGLPRASGSIRRFLAATRGRVLSELAVFLLIDSTKTHQLFVVQALEALIQLMELLPDDAAA